MSRERGVIIAGAAETDAVGKLPDHSTLQLHLEAAVNAVADAGLTMRDIDGIATVNAPGPMQVAHALGITPAWMDGTARRRHLVPAARPARRGRDQGRVCQHDPHHARRVGAIPSGGGPVPARGIVDPRPVRGALRNDRARPRPSRSRCCAT